MSSTEVGWESLLHTDAPSGCSLKAALFTTYDRADERFLAEHLLPLLLKLSREPESEGAERQYFLLELDRHLKQLHGRLMVVSSMAREEPADSEGESATYHWIWRSIRHLPVGRHGKAVQHAKLWLLHWGAADKDGIEYLELVVSSANLTLAAFKGQIQAAWRACVELHPKRSDARLKRWGVLPEFLRELATSAGDDARLAPFIELLARADCPVGVTFVASVPGTHSRAVLRRAPWGVEGLRKITPSGRGTVHISILSPFIGSWSTETLTCWCETLQGSPARLELVWIDKYHPWAIARRWLLPEATLKSLVGAGAGLLRLRHAPDNREETDLLHDEHRPGDLRWSHAKVYSLQRGNSRRLLVTSANFSMAAWGSANREGELTIENFELGVCIEQATWPFDDLEAFDSDLDVATVPEPTGRDSSMIMWAQAMWDGKKVEVDCRCEENGELEGKVKSASVWTTITSWTVDASDHRRRSAQVVWEDSRLPPSTVQLTCKYETVSVPIFDQRPSSERELTLPPEVDEETAQMMRDELLFEQYGGRVAADTMDQALSSSDEDLDGGSENGPEGGGHSDSYDVPAFVLARRHLRVVDNWSDQVKLVGEHATEKFERHLLRRDGELLLGAFQRQAARDETKETARAIGARLAVEELTIRLKYFPEA